MAKILIADDQVEIRRLIAYRLEKKSHQIVMAHDGVEAIAALSKDKFDLAILDISMPKKSGLDVLQFIRHHNDNLHLPVIMLTASALSNHYDEAVEYKANIYLTKPVSSQEMYTAVESLLAEHD